MTPSIRLLGARRSLLELLENLQAARWQRFVVCSGRGGLQEQIARQGIPHAIIPHYAWRKGRYFAARVFQAWRIARVIGRENPAILHANEFHSLPHALAALRIRAWLARSAPQPVTVHVRLGITPRQIRTYGLARASRVVVVSHAVASLFDSFPKLRRRVRVVHNGVDLRRYLPVDAEVRHQARTVLGLRDTDFVAGLVGLISPRKCQHVAVEAVARLKETCPNLRLVFAGEPFESSRSYAESVRRQAAEAGLGSVVSFVGFREDIGAVYSALDLNLLLSEEEGFGRTIIEAGAMGVPSIGTRVGGIPELIGEEETGRLIDAHDPAALADALRFLQGHPEVVRGWGENARRRVVAAFSIEAHVRALETVWDEALQESLKR